MRPSFFVLQPLFVRKHRVKPGKKPPLCIRVHRKVVHPWWQVMAIFRCDAFPKGPRTEKTPSRGKILPPCIQNELVLARYVLHVFKMPCKAPFGNTSRGYLAIKAPFCRPNPLNHA